MPGKPRSGGDEVVHLEGAALCGKPFLPAADRRRPVSSSGSFKPSAPPLSLISLAPKQTVHLRYGE
jgi:hypothetical protein